MAFNVIKYLCKLGAFNIIRLHMESAPRHQCLVYQGAPSQHLPLVAPVIREKLEQNYRCLYLNSAPMVAGMRSYLAAAGIDVAHESAKGSLVLSSEQQHLRGGLFDADAMLQSLEDTLRQALRDGYAGLWATGDMTWEFDDVGVRPAQGLHAAARI